MGRPRLHGNKLVTVAGSVRPEVAAALEIMAREKPCTLAAAVRSVIESSPRIKAALKNGKKK